MAWGVLTNFLVENVAYEVTKYPKMLNVKGVLRMAMNIYQSINAILNEVEAVGKTKENTVQHFKFRGIDDVMNAIHPLLAKHKVFVVPEVLRREREERQSTKGGNLIYSICDIKFKFYAEDGSSIEAITTGEGMDSGDKATNKAMAIAFKYALFQVFCIPTEEMKDPDSDTPEPSQPKLSDKQINRLYAIARNANIDRDKVVQQVHKKYGCTPELLNKAQYDEVCNGYERLSANNGH